MIERYRIMMRELYKLAYKRINRYKNNRDGATAIEFALLAIPFFMLLFAILELAIIFFISSTLSHAVSETGRQMRVGNFQNCGQAAFKAMVCEEMAGVGSCNRLRIDAVTNTHFKTVTLPTIPPPPPTPPGAVAPPAIPNGVYTPGIDSTAGVPVILRATYYHKLILPPELTRLENLPGSGTRVLATSTAFRNEPFPAQSCPPPPPTN